MFVWSERSLRSMEGVHPDLRTVMDLALDRTKIDFVVIEGLRTLERQRHLLAIGASTTLNSRHLTGHAVDICPIDDGEISWHFPLYDLLSDVVKLAARDLQVSITWGGDWRSPKDGPHYQLAWKRYPIGGV